MSNPSDEFDQALSHFLDGSASPRGFSLASEGWGKCYDEGRATAMQGLPIKYCPYIATIEATQHEDGHAGCQSRQYASRSEKPVQGDIVFENCAWRPSG